MSRSGQWRGTSGSGMPGCTERAQLRGAAGHLVRLAACGLWACCAAFGGFSGTRLGADEPAVEFVQALRENRFHDMALKYLDQMQRSPLATVSFRERILFEKAETLIDGAKYQRDAGIRAKQLDEAQKYLQQFIAERPNSDVIERAKRAMGNLLVERARMALSRSERVADKTALVGEARGLFDQAGELFTKSKADLKERLEALPPVIAPEQKRERELQDNLRADYLQAMLLSAAILEEKAATYPPQDAQRKQLYEQAAEQYGTIYEKYRRRLAGLYALMYQGRCNKEIGNHKEALSYFEDLLEQPDDPQEFRDLKTKALRLAMESWLDPSQNKFVVAAQRGSEWVQKARPAENRESEWLALRLLVAKAHRALAEELAQKNPRDPQIGRSRSEARKQAELVARYKSEFQEEAQTLLTMLRGQDPAAPKDRPEPTSFVEARDQGQEILRSLRTAQLIVKRLPARIERETDQENKQDLEKQLADAQKTLETGQAEALDVFRKAVELVDGETTGDDLNVVHYFLAYLYFQEEDFYQAAVTAEFVSTRFPGSAGARPCGKIAMLAYNKLYQDAKDANREAGFLAGKTAEMAEHITRVWPKQPEAEDAFRLLIPLMIVENQLERAIGYLEQIPPASEGRGAAELMTGQAMWSKYLEGMKQLRAQVEQGPVTETAELKNLKEKAQQTLANGVSRMKDAGEVTETMAAAALSLAQIYTNVGDAAAALKLLEDPAVGPLTLVEANENPAVKRPEYQQATYTTALRSYISALASGADTAEMMGRAKAMMEALKASAGDDDDGRKRLVGLYFGLAKDLQQQLELATDPAAKKALSRGFETFLQQVRGNATDFSVVNWVADTFYGLAEGMKDEDPAEAAKHFAQALETYQQIRVRGEQDKTYYSSEAMEGRTKLRIAMASREAGSFTDAMTMFEQLLDANRTNIDIQQQAAMTYQLWAGRETEPAKIRDRYMKAMVGARPDPNSPSKERIVWGWGKIAQKTARVDKFRDYFHTARYNLAECRMRIADTETSPDKQQEGYAKAKSDIVKTFSAVQVKDEAWRAKYDLLLKQIQRKLKEKPDGLLSLERA